MTNIRVLFKMWSIVFDRNDSTDFESDLRQKAVMLILGSDF